MEVLPALERALAEAANAPAPLPTVPQTRNQQTQKVCGNPLFLVISGVDAAENV